MKFFIVFFFLRNKVEIFVERHFKYSKVYYLKKIFSLNLITIYTISFNFRVLKIIF